MNKRLLVHALAIAVMTTARAGGLMTNTNYHIAFDRMMARGASTEIDAAYSNPAGLAWGYEGLQLSLDFQKPWQNRDIEYNGQTYEGKASAPIVPALFAAYKKDCWALSAMLGIVGSGGFVEYKQGVPMFNVLMSGLLGANGFTPGSYSLDSEMKGKQYIYGGQVNFTYRLADWLSAAVGLRANYYDGYYRGHVIADDLVQPYASRLSLGRLASLLLDVDQKGWGFTPLVSVNFHQGPLTVAARYEFRTKISTENETNILDAGLGTNVVAALMAADPAGAAAKLAALKSQLATYTASYEDGVSTRYDMPALLAVAALYEITPKLRATAEYHFFDDKQAKMGGDRQEQLTGGTHELQLGAEYDVSDKFTVSLGGQRTDYGLSDEYQQDTSFACDSYSIGLGGAWNVTEKIRLNAGYFITLYSNYTKQASYGQETFKRTNNVIGLGIDFKF